MTVASATRACAPALRGPAAGPRGGAALARVAGLRVAAAPRAGRLAVGLAGAAVVVNLLVSGNLLAAAGIPYAADGGSIVVKLHPGTYLAVLSVVAMAWRRPVATAAALAAEARVPLLYLASLAGCCGFALAGTGRVHLVVFLENFMPAGLLALVLGRAGERALRRLGLVVLGVLVLGVVVSVGETLGQRHLVPIVLAGREELEPAAEFRGAGLYDHPLTGAMLTAAGLFLAGSEGIGRGWRVVLAAVFGVGLVAFGGRTALVLAAVVFAGWRGAGMLGRLVRRALRRSDLVAAGCAVSVVPAGLALLLTQTGVGARLVTHLYWDDSARVRNVQWHLLPMMDPGEKLFGMTLQRQELALHQLSLHWRIGGGRELLAADLPLPGGGGVRAVRRGVRGVPGLGVPQGVAAGAADAGRGDAGGVDQQLARPQGEPAHRAGADGARVGGAAQARGGVARGGNGHGAGCGVRPGGWRRAPDAVAACACRRAGGGRRRAGRAGAGGMMADAGLAAAAGRGGVVRAWRSGASGFGRRVAGVRLAGVRQALLLGGGAALGQGVAVLSAPLLTRLYDVAAFGVFGSFSAAASCLACVATLRLDQAILLERDEDAAGDVLRLCVLSVGAVTLVAGLGAAGAAGRAPGAVLALLPLAVACGGVVPALTLWFVRRERFGPVAAYGASRSGFAVALQGLGGWLGVPGAGLLVGGQVAGQALAAALLARAGGAGLRAALCGGWSVARLRGAASRHRGFALYGAPQVLLRLLSTSLPAMLLPLFFGAAQAGLFWLAYRMLVLPQQVLTESLRPVFFRQAAALHAQGGDVRGAALRLAGGLGALCLPVVAVLAFAGPALFGAVFGAAWRGAGHDAAMIALAWGVETMQMPSAVLVSVLGRQRAYLGIEAASLLARAAALCAGAAWGGPDLAVGLYAAAWAATNAGVIAWMAWPPGAAAQGAGA